MKNAPLNRAQPTTDAAAMVRTYQAARCSHSGYPCPLCYRNAAMAALLRLQHTEPWAVAGSRALAHIVEGAVPRVARDGYAFRGREAATADVMVAAGAVAYIHAMRRQLPRHRAAAEDAARAAIEAARTVYADAPEPEKYRWRPVPEWRARALAAGLREARRVLRDVPRDDGNDNDNDNDDGDDGAAAEGGEEAGVNEEVEEEDREEAAPAPRPQPAAFSWLRSLFCGCCARGDRGDEGRER